jgi:hypothetical protein
MAREYTVRPIYNETWDNALDLAVFKAKDFFPQEHHARIDRALDIALDGRIMILKSGDAVVESDESLAQDAKVYHIVKGHCECPDSKYRSPWCKHNIARALMIRANEYLTGTH